MSRRSSLKRLSSVSQEGLIQESIYNFDTWPVLPSGILVKPSSSGFDTEKVTRQSMQSFEQFMKYFDLFIQVKSSIMLFFFSALIGIIGNLLITVLYSKELIIYNLGLSFALFLFIIILVRVAIMYSPEYSMDYIIQGEYEEFPKGYESYIDLEKIEDPIMKMYIDVDYFPNLITKYSIFVRSCRLKDYIVNALKETKFVKINQISQLSDYYPSFSISFTTNLYAFLHPRNKDEIRSEFLSLNGAINTGKIGEGVMAFELDEGEWKKYGAQFLNEISHINLDEVLSQLTDEIKSACKDPSIWRREWTIARSDIKLLFYNFFTWWLYEMMGLFSYINSWKIVIKDIIISQKFRCAPVYEMSMNYGLDWKVHYQLIVGSREQPIITHLIKSLFPIPILFLISFILIKLVDREIRARNL